MVEKVATGKLSDGLCTIIAYNGISGDSLRKALESSPLSEGFDFSAVHKTNYMAHRIDVREKKANKEIGSSNKPKSNVAKTTTTEGACYKTL